MLTKAKGGKLPDAADVFLDTHFKKGKEPVPISQKAKEVMVMLFSLFTSHLMFRAEFRLQSRRVRIGLLFYDLHLMFRAEFQVISR